MRDLNYDLKQLCRRNRDGSFATQADREHILDLVADQLHQMGFRHMNAHSLKPKHVEKLVERWLAENLSPGTIKNRMTALRWWAEKIGKENIIARTNAAYGIADRVYVTNVSKAKDLAAAQIEQIRTLSIRISLRLQTAFGLRREESIKIVPSWADRGHSLMLKDSWCKGGRQREIPIRTLGGIAAASTGDRYLGFSYGSATVECRQAHLVASRSRAGYRLDLWRQGQGQRRHSRFAK